MPWITIKNKAFDIKTLSDISLQNECIIIGFHSRLEHECVDCETPEKAKEAFHEVMDLINGLTR